MASILSDDDNDVKEKTEPTDTKPVEIQPVQDRGKTWVKVRDISLTYYDKGILASGEKLSDKHINLVQRILKTKFPKINGLCLTLLQDKAHKEPTNNVVQPKAWPSGNIRIATEVPW